VAAIRRLTPAGIDAARQFLAGVRADPTGPLLVPRQILQGRRETSEIPDAPEVIRRTFASRRAAAVHLNAAFGPFGSRIVDDDGAWSWLGMFYFADTVPIDAGRPRLSPLDETFVFHRGDPRSFQRRYRHYLWSAWRLYRQHGEAAAFLLDAPLYEMGDIADRVLSNARVFNSVGVVPLIMRLYTESGRQKRSFGRGPGGLRHLLRVLNQLERTHDVYAMQWEQIAALLPPEFDRWLPADAQRAG